MMPGLMDRLRSYATATDRPISLPPPKAPAYDGQHGQQLGMTETLAAYIVNGGWDRPIAPEDRDAHGYKVPHMQYRIADLETGETLPDGVEGEICVRGYSLTVGMLKRERHEVYDDDGWYHTGDKGILRGDLIVFTGRAKDLIKTAGANVAPREVEILLDADPGVLLSLVVGVPDPEREENVAVALVPVSGADLDPPALIRRVAKDLSAYKVPRRYLVLPEAELPYLATGKPDRAKVRDLVIAGGTDLSSG
jgi:acyl-CoA synthetase (AMP-forming)/AMP-acid ligase II